MKVAKKYLTEDYCNIDLMKGVTLKTAKEIDHLAMNVPFHSRLKIMGEVI